MTEKPKLDFAKEVYEEFGKKLLLPARVEFNLSNKIFKRKYSYSKNKALYCDNLLVKDVKEFIKRLKDEYCACKIYHQGFKCKFCKFIDALAGKELLE